MKRNIYSGYRYRNFFIFIFIDIKSERTKFECFFMLSPIYFFKICEMSLAKEKKRS